MAANSFLEQKPANSISFGAVLLLHGAVIGGLLLIKGPSIWVDRAGPLETSHIPLEEPPPVDPPKTEPQKAELPTLSRYDVPPPLIRTPAPATTRADPVPIPSTAEIGTDVRPPMDPALRPSAESLIPIPPRRPDPVRVEAQFDPRFANALQPPYPPSEVRADREGLVSVRVTIAPSGRVVAIQRISATSEAFWRATERHALSRWRFRPATLDGQPVESSKTLSVRFRLDGR